jgi:hypothetical protein
LLPKESDRIEEEDLDSYHESTNLKPKMKELRISYLNGVKGALDDIENNPPSSSEDEVIANRSSHKSLEREDL